MIRTELANWITIVSGLIAAAFWLWSALLRVPDYVETMVNEPGSIPSIIKRQSRLSAIAAIFTAISVLAQAPAAFLGAEITTDQKQFVVSSDQTSVTVHGTWHRIADRPTIGVPRVNSVRIECDRTAGVCNEYVAKFIQKSDDPTGTVERAHLFLMKEQFRVIEWTGTTVTARAEPRAADIDLRISFADHSAERTSRETESRGAKVAHSQNVIHWVVR
jgi:hypothetical protein